MGVKRAIRLAEEASGKEQRTTLYHQIVHNEKIIKRMEENGIVSSESIPEIDGGAVIIPAHGAPPEVYHEAEEKGLQIIDATCPLVLRVQKIVAELAEEGYFILHLGDPEHDETAGIAGHAGGNFAACGDPEALLALDIRSDKLALTAQTTADVEQFEQLSARLREKHPDLLVKNTICSATSKRQKAAVDLAKQSDLFLVLGSGLSANSRRLYDLAVQYCDRAYFLNGADELQESWLEKENSEIKIIGITAGASTPDETVRDVIVRIKEFVGKNIEVVFTKSSDSEIELCLDN